MGRTGAVRGGELHYMEMKLGETWHGAGRGCGAGGRLRPDAGTL